jgi:hypothetical protein
VTADVDNPAPFDLGGAITPYVLSELLNAERLAEVVAAIARYTGDPRVMRAAGQLCGDARGGGRPSCDDSAALVSMTALIETGEACSIEMAAKIVARTIPRKHSLQSTINRIAGKYRRSVPRKS